MVRSPFSEIANDGRAAEEHDGPAPPAFALKAPKIERAEPQGEERHVEEALVP